MSFFLNEQLELLLKEPPAYGGQAVSHLRRLASGEGRSRSGSRQSETDSTEEVTKSVSPTLSAEEGAKSPVCVSTSSSGSYSVTTDSGAHVRREGTNGGGRHAASASAADAGEAGEWSSQERHQRKQCMKLNLAGQQQQQADISREGVSENTIIWHRFGLVILRFCIRFKLNCYFCIYFNHQSTFL